MSKKPKVKAGVAVIVYRGHRILVGERQGSHGEGLLAFPGGHIEPTDVSLAACGEREVFEETGIIARIHSPDHYRQDLFTTFDVLGTGKFYVTSYLVAEYLHGGQMEGDWVLPQDVKCKGWFWMSLDDLANQIRTPEQKVWIPLESVLFYLKQMWRLD